LLVRTYIFQKKFCCDCLMTFAGAKAPQSLGDGTFFITVANIILCDERFFSEIFLAVRSSVPKASGQPIHLTAQQWLINGLTKNITVLACGGNNCKSNARLTTLTTMGPGRKLNCLLARASPPWSSVPKDRRRWVQDSCQRTVSDKKLRIKFPDPIQARNICAVKFLQYDWISHLDLPFRQMKAKANQKSEIVGVSGVFPIFCMSGANDYYAGVIGFLLPDQRIRVPKSSGICSTANSCRCDILNSYFFVAGGNGPITAIFHCKSANVLTKKLRGASLLLFAAFF